MPWYEGAKPDGSTAGWPQWARTAWVDDDGRVFLAAALIGINPAIVVAAALFEGVGRMVDNGHAYLPAEWLAGAYPEHAELLRTIAGDVLRGHLAHVGVH